MPVARMTEAQLQAHQSKQGRYGNSHIAKNPSFRIGIDPGKNTGFAVWSDIKNGGVIKIKPLTANRLWAGRRVKSHYYKEFERKALILLPTDVEVPSGNLSVCYEFGFSSPLADWDNPIKPFQDILQKKYGFDDRWIIEAVITKKLVPKGEEYIGFNIEAAK